MDPREDDVEVVPVGRLDGRRDRRRAAIVIAAVALLVAIGLVSAQLKRQVPPVAVVPIATPAATAGTTPSPSTSAEVTPPRLTAAELIEAVHSGSLEGTLVFADARLDVECGDSHQPCADPTLAVEGLALDVLPGTLGTAVGIPLPRSLLVLEVEGTRLVYRGALIVQSNGTPRYEVLAGGSAARPPDPSALTDVAGWLALDGPCLGPPKGPLPCARRATLADQEPTSPAGRADAGPTVAVPVGAWGIDDAAWAIVPGPFLVRQNPATGDREPAWQVVARYDPSRSVRVVIP